ncbi:MAG: AIM24 family protein [Burkholderiales bacterium]|nr:AIM24 family protein [Burkholderiales bacterium]MDE1925741.1 AIM24 family protein [Burkholderiales bacterium]MDE2157989.1 AIM24 family protein [Burkholderiales bacterium]
MKSRINGTTLPVLEIGLEAGDRIVSEPGQFSWMSPNVVLTTTALTAGSKGLWGALGRAVSGGGLFMNEYHVGAGQGMVAFAAKVPGSIMELQVDAGRSYLVHRHGFLCGTEGVELSIGFQRSLGAGIFGGEGMILQKLAGRARAWVELGGEVVSYDLAPGESLNVHPGHIGMFESSVQFDITLIPGLKNMIFGGDGLFIARLTGPGKIWLQTLTMPNLAHALSPYFNRDGASATTVGAGIGGSSAGLGGAIAGGVVGSVLGSLFGDRDS